MLWKLILVQKGPIVSKFDVLMKSVTFCNKFEMNFFEDAEVNKGFVSLNFQVTCFLGRK